MTSPIPNPQLRILFAEDVSTDREMVERLLRQNKFDFISECVDSEQEFRQMLVDFKPTIILSDYRMPSFDGMKALKIAQDEMPDVPFIVLTGSINEDIAVECMRNGADDYVIKQNLKRLIPSIHSAIEKKKLKRSQEEIQKQLESSDMKYRMLIEQSVDAIFMLLNNKFIFVNRNFESWFQINLDELNSPDFVLTSIVDAECLKEFQNNISAAVKKPGTSLTFEMQLLFSSGKHMDAEIAFSSFQYNDEVAYQGVIHDISQRKKLLERNVLLSRAMEQSPVSIVITNSEATIEYVNPAYERSTGYTFEELIGRNQNILKSGHHSSEFYALMWEQLKNGKIWQGEIKNRTKNGNILWESMSISPIFNTQGALEHFVGVKEDITAKMQTLEELRIAKEKAEESDRLKSAFLATMSHELRTPLNQIIGFSGIIPQMTNDDSIIEFASQINKSGNDLLALIEDIFQMSMVEKTPVVLRRNEVMIKDILHQLKIYLDELLVESGKTDEIRLDYSIQESLIERSIITDKPKLIQALLQIIKNAVKFTHKGVISLQFELTPSRILNISIKDTGIGIPAEKLNYIFDFFRQGDESLTRTYGGVGIGLALSKKIAEAMNARIHVTTRENVGSEFTFELPLDENSLL